VAAARYDAHLSLTRRIYNIPMGANNTLLEVAERTRLRTELDAALRAAEPLGEPLLKDSGLVYVTIALDTETLPEALRARLRLPKQVRSDGIAHKPAAVRTATAPVEKVSDSVAEWMETTLEAKGSAQVFGPATQEQNLLRARRQAFLNAYAEMAAKVGALNLDDKCTVTQFLDQHADLIAGVNATIPTAKLLGASLEGATYSVSIALPARRLMVPLRLGPYRRLSPMRLTADRVALARSNALADATERLKQRVAQAPLVSGITAGKMMEDREAVAEAIARLCESRPIERVVVSDQGFVKLHLNLAARSLPRDLQELLAPAAPTVFQVAGAGLPMAPKPQDTETQKPDPDKPPANTVVGTAAVTLAPYTTRGLSVEMAANLAKGAGKLIAQRELIRNYAATFLKKKDDIDAFLIKSDLVTAKAEGGILKGVTVRKEALNDERTEMVVTVQATLDDLRAALGGAPEPKPERPE